MWELLLVVPKECIFACSPIVGPESPQEKKKSRTSENLGIFGEYQISKLTGTSSHPDPLYKFLGIAIQKCRIKAHCCPTLPGSLALAKSSHQDCTNLGGKWQSSSSYPMLITPLLQPHHWESRNKAVTMTGREPMNFDKKNLILYVITKNISRISMKWVQVEEKEHKFLIQLHKRPCLHWNVNWKYSFWFIFSLLYLRLVCNKISGALNHWSCSGWLYYEGT